MKTFSRSVIINLSEERTHVYLPELTALDIG
jgi:hypothetical protein